MAHTFFENNSNYIVRETREVDQFTVEIGFAPDDTQLDLLFDTDADYYPELIENLESGFWQHMICRVQAKYDGTVMGEDYLGSCVAEDGADFQEQSPDLIADMIETALEEARKGIAELKAKLIADFG
mgnify:CR=1 FL=1|tara:strand:+ start:2023 stop:2403 length:381 start_codon:yes stop_codon:yes gene_type:complete